MVKHLGMRTFLFFLFFTTTLTVFSQNNQLPTNNYQQEFTNAYNQYPDVPKGVLEAVAYTMTRFNHLQNTTESCTGLPKTYGVMGMTLDGQNYFRNNLNYISQVSGIAVNDMIQNPQQNILAYAAAYHHELTLLSPFYYKSQNFAHILTKLSELPNNELQQDYALNAHLYGVLSFLNDTKMQKAYNFPNHQLDLKRVFGEENLKVLQSAHVSVSENGITGDYGETYKQSNNKSVDYPPALSNLTSCNFSSRGVPISAVTVHTIQGTYAGAISWANNCSSNVSYHYVLRSNDGQVTQVVLETDKAWHVGSENPYTIGMEHEGFVNDSSWYTAAMYQSSADLVRDITQSGYGINPLRTAYFPWASTTNYNASSIPGSCIKIKGHQHYPNQTHTDPGANWDWDYYFKLINDPTSTTVVNTNATGNVTDLGGTGTYTDDERTLFLIQPTNATAITLTVNQFDTEPGWDYLYIYDGATVFDPLIGRYDGTSIPSTFNIVGSAVLIEFRTDCATTAAGYDISWTGTIITDVDELSSQTAIVYPNPFDDQVTVTLADNENVALTLLDVTGRIIFNEKITPQNKSIKLDLTPYNLHSGIYFIQIESAQKNQTIKLIKH